MRYQHIVLTLPEEFRELFLRNRGLLKVILSCASKSLIKLFQEKFKCTPGIISVIHTFGGDIKRNPHIHVIITSGGLTKNNTWKWINFIPCNSIKEYRKYTVVNNCKKWLKKNNYHDYLNNTKTLNDLCHLGRYINIGGHLDSLEYTIKYIGRYVKRPVIAETRIIGMTDESISFTHKDKQTQEEITIDIPIYEFLGKLCRHVPDKYMKVVSFGGIFANRTKKKNIEILQKIFNNNFHVTQNLGLPKDRRNRIISLTGKDPYICTNCGATMQRQSLTYRLKSGQYKTKFLPP